MATIYVDFNSNSGTLTGTWTFTNGSTNVSGAGGSATSELASGDYVRVSNGTQWYKVNFVQTDDSFYIDPSFKQATVTDDANATLYNDKDGSSTANAFSHPHQATIDTVRSAGDVIKLRANQTHLFNSDDFDVDDAGDANNYIVLKGCDSTDDPWSDGSDVQPIIDFDDTNVQACLDKNYWKLQNLDIKSATRSTGGVLINGAALVLENCIFRGHDAIGVRIFQAQYAKFIDCEFHSNGTYSLELYSGIADIEGCTFNGGTGTTVGLKTGSNPCIALIKDSTFGVSSDHSEADIKFTSPSWIICRNTKLDSVTEVAGIEPGSFVKIEDDEQTKLANRAWYWTGTIQRGTSDVGGITHWLRAIPNSNCGSEQPLGLFEDLPLWLPASQKTITVSMRGNSWAGMPTNSELYIELAYYDGATATRAKVQSTEVLSANDTWTNFTVTITPNSAGPAYLSAFLKDYEDSSESIYVDISSLPTIT